MSVADVLTRVETICKKYEKYDADKKKDSSEYKNDRFMQLYTSLQADLEAALQKANDASIEKNRAVVATLNAEIRRAKEAMKEHIPKLTKYAGKKVKGVAPEELALRPELVTAIVAKIEAIPDGIVAPHKLSKGKGSMTPHTIKLDDSLTPEQLMRGAQSQGSQESSSFAQEYGQRKNKQEQGLDMISDGLTTLGNMAQDINEELDKQTALTDEITSKVDKAETELKSTNTRLKETLVKLRSGRRLIFDVILLIVVMSIAAALYKIIIDKKKKNVKTS